jgi:hypothetical protein
MVQIVLAQAQQTLAIHVVLGESLSNLLAIQFRHSFSDFLDGPLQRTFRDVPEFREYVARVLHLLALQRSEFWIPQHFRFDEAIYVVPDFLLTFL